MTSFIIKKRCMLVACRSMCRTMAEAFFQQWTSADDCNDDACRMSTLFQNKNASVCENMDFKRIQITLT